ncbi:AgrD family cyclic lactone autoinducer peptide [Vallitalea pronyensis]
MDKLLLSMSSIFMFASFFVASKSSWFLFGETSCPKSLRK